ncbi:MULTISPECIES: hypothetical protein [unclassified Herbaspirillum]|uniref:hypothetical protein n=1 Tax=unclassified Herbaspirillum TaxID=2624150 RepID=UPI00383AD38D
MEFDERRRCCKDGNPSMTAVLAWEPGARIIMLAKRLLDKESHAGAWFLLLCVFSMDA